MSVVIKYVDAFEMKLDSDKESVVLVNNTAIHDELIGYQFEPRGELPATKNRDKQTKVGERR